MTCDECENRWLELIAGELPPDEGAGLREHIAGCATCSHGFAELESAMNAVGDVPLEEPPARVDDAVMRAARAKVAGMDPAAAMRGAAADQAGFFASLAQRWSRFVAGPQVAMATVMVLVVAIGVWYLPHADLRAPMEGETLIAPDDTSAAPGSAGATPVEEASEKGASAEPMASAESFDQRKLEAQEIPTDDLKAPSGRARRAATDSLAMDEGVTNALSDGLVNDGLARKKSRKSMVGDDMLFDFEGDSDAQRYGGGGSGLGGVTANASTRASASGAGARDEAPAAPAPTKASSELATTASQLFTEARSLAASGRCADAVKVYGALLSNYPTFASRALAYDEQATCYRKLGQTSLALAAEQNAKSVRATESNVAAKRAASRPAAAEPAAADDAE
ncbi:MAG: zf-HC2 domain-containing protein [Myxococcales bacterium]|nr:zf-HC2 domain-containing protein [Myxococcales bacterium]